MAGIRSVLTLVLAYLAVVESLDVVCYVTSWAQYRPGTGRHTVDNVKPHLCTHIIFAFAVLKGTDRTDTANHEENDEQMWRKLNDFKYQNANLKTMLAIGGYNERREPWAIMVETKQRRSSFISKLIKLLRNHRFDGVDLDWEYPETASDKQKLSLLLMELRQSFNAEAQQNSRTPLLLSMAVAAGIDKAAKAYDVPVLERTLDFYNVMTYDYNGPWDLKTGLSSPLYAPAGDTYNVKTTMDWYRCQGASIEKLRLGLALFGHSWTLQNSNNNGLGALAISPGVKGKYTRTAGVLSQYEICANLAGGYTSTLDPVGQINYGSKGNQFMSFETIKSIDIKIDYAKKQGFHGVMIWSIPMDDFTAKTCGVSYADHISKAVMNVRFNTSPERPVCNGPINPPTIPRTNAPYIPRTNAPYIPRTNAPYIPRTNAPYIPRTNPPATQPPYVQPTAKVNVPSKPGTYYKDRSTCAYQSGRFADPHSCRHYYTCYRKMPIRGRCHFGAFNPVSLACDTYYQCY